MKKYILPLGFFVAGVLSTFGVVFAQSTISFPDVKPTDWFYKDVMNMVQWDVIRGNDDGTFKPQAGVNRAELSAMWNRYDKSRVLPLEDRMMVAEFNISKNWLMKKIDDYVDSITISPKIYCNKENTTYQLLLSEKDTFNLSYGSIDDDERYFGVRTGVENVNKYFPVLKDSCEIMGYSL